LIRKQNMPDILPIGKLPVEVLTNLLSKTTSDDPRIILGPGIGLDCAVLDMGERLLVLKSDPITFATDEIGWYGVQVNANDIATTGADPKWMLVTLLLPEGSTTTQTVDQISSQVSDACRINGITVVGGHTEITYGIDRPILMGTMLGEVSHDNLITPLGAKPGDRILLTKGVPIEATAIIAREFADKMSEEFSNEEINQAQNFLYDPGISVLKDAKLARQSGQVTAMHDPTEGGLLAALWELADACGSKLVIETEKIYIPQLSEKICKFFGINPLAAIASGALLLTAREEASIKIATTLNQAGIYCSEIGVVEEGTPSVWQVQKAGRTILDRPQRDEISFLFENSE
jgi:hydrogenase expression/formation protein HypE